MTLWKYSILYTIPDVWHSYIDIFSCISVFTHLLSCRKDQPRQRCTDCLKTKRRNASAFLEQLRWSNQAPAGKWNRRNPIQVSLYFKSNIAWFHIIINDKCFLMSILGFPGCLAPSQTGVDTSPSNPAAGDLTSLGCFKYIFRFNFHQKIIPRVRTTSPQVTCWTCSWPWQGRGGQ